MGQGEGGCKGPRGVDMVSTSQLHLYLAKVHQCQLLQCPVTTWTWTSCDVSLVPWPHQSDDEDDSLVKVSLSWSIFQNFDGVNISDAWSLFHFCCDLLWYFTPLTTCLKCFSCTSNSFDLPDDGSLYAILSFDEVCHCHCHYSHCLG